MTDISAVETLARRVAERAHRDQVDKAGAPYIDHVARVVEGVSSPEERAVAWLHDTLEDTGVTGEYLLLIGIPEHIVDAVEAVSHFPGEARSEYYSWVAANPLARAVKLSDIADNADPSRLALLDKPTRARLVAKYAKARKALTP